MFSRIVLALALVAGASAFAPASFGARVSSALNANIMDTAATLKGPNVPWGSDGVLLGYEESDIKGTDDFSNFVAAVNAAGLGPTLASGEYTVLAPVNSAFDKAGPVSADVLKYHVIPGRITKESIAGDLPTLNGASLTYKRFARQTFVDDAVVGMVPQGAATGSVYPVNIACDNGLIHAIDRVLKPGWTKVDEMAGATNAY